MQSDHLGLNSTVPCEACPDHLSHFLPHHPAFSSYQQDHLGGLFIPFSLTNLHESWGYSCLIYPSNLRPGLSME